MRATSGTKPGDRRSGGPEQGGTKAMIRLWLDRGELSVAPVLAGDWTVDWLLLAAPLPVFTAPCEGLRFQVMHAIAAIDVRDFAQYRLTTETPLQLVDVREAAELELAALDGFLHLPLSQSAAWAPQIHTLLDAQTETIVMCHHGVRSAQMCQWLMAQGFTNVKNLTGGIEAYAQLVDPTVPLY